MMKNKLGIKNFNYYAANELESDAYSKFYQMDEFLLEKIYITDEREQVFLINAFENIIKLNLPNIVQYYEIDYNEKEKCIEVLRRFYKTKLLDHQIRNKFLVVTITQQLFQTLASLEGFGVHLLGLKATNIFFENDNIYISGFVRSEKFLLSQPIFQSKHLKSFIQECITTKKYNITQRYQRKSHAMIYAALTVLLQFILNEDFEQIANIIRWLDNGEDNLKAVPSTQKLLAIIEEKYDCMRIFIEQAKCLLTNEFLNPTEDLAIQMMLLASELRFENNIIVLGEYYNLNQKTEIKQQQQLQKDTKIQQPKELNVQIEQNKQKVKSAQAKRCGGGFVVKQKK
ncbi:unnamed protein product [Paramecium pentaurelia]|uniref:Protein kinase domain-containing protein n=1 Tax=Paramecium pentaurelia TaxID=43138 RepID=A0A8S1V5D9_9CILI|nr:unnamed protein product [Paramecium pentaurelia]